MDSQLITTIDSISTSKKELVTQILIVFILPILFIKFDILAVEYRVPVLVALITILVATLIKEKWTFKMLGVGNGTFKKYLLPYTIFTIVGVFSITLLGTSLGYQQATNWWTQPHFLYLFFVVSLFQEVGYRGYLIPALGKITQYPLWIIFLNTLLFTFLHVIFSNLIVGLPLAFVGGIGFALMYMKYPNLPLIVISHSILNFCAVLYGFFTVSGIN